MEFYNEITITMENNDAANTALAIIKEVLCSGDYSAGYKTKVAEELANDIYIKGSQILLDENSYYLVEDIVFVIEDVLKKIAEIDTIRQFECKVFSYSTYSDGMFIAD